jgi:hypothetical protein
METITGKKDIYYFGCWGEAGHYLFRPNRTSVYRKDHPGPWARIDGELAPHGPETRSKNQVQGEAVLWHRDGWTALGWWDRSGDSRGNSNSNLIAEGLFTAKEMISLGQEYFPEIMRRQPTPITVVAMVGVTFSFIYARCLGVVRDLRKKFESIPCTSGCMAKSPDGGPCTCKPELEDTYLEVEGCIQALQKEQED